MGRKEGERKGGEGGEGREGGKERGGGESTPMHCIHYDQLCVCVCVLHECLSCDVAWTMTHVCM